MTAGTNRPVVLSIAGSDSSGGAGVQGDLLTVAAMGAHGACAVTAVTAQGADGVHSWWPLEPAAVEAQLAAVFGTMPVAAVKTGMLGSRETARAVVRALRDLAVPIVVDPVCVSSSGHDLLGPGAFEVLRDELLPLAALITPNLAEVRRLTGTAVASPDDLERAGAALLLLGPAAALMTGGHLPGDPVDVLVYGRTALHLVGVRHDTVHTHGSGCALAAAVATRLACGDPLDVAVRRAHDHVAGAVAAGYPVGVGAGPVDHLWAVRRP